MIKNAFARIPECVKEPLRIMVGKPHPYGLARSERKRIAKLPRYAPTTTKLFGRTIRIADGASFLASHDEIFCQRIYEVPRLPDGAIVIDAGANVGLATIDVAMTHPKASIIAIESDPQVSAILRFNLQSFEIENVVVLEGAVWDEDSMVRFSPDHADAGRIDDAGSLHVKAIRLKHLISKHEHIDFLKLDVEGAELRVLADCESELSRVQRLFVEYHSPADQPQQLAELLGILERASLRYYITDTGVHSSTPLVQRQTEAGFDLQLNIFATRDIGLFG